jgi:DNA-binding CsgD family transcriptional regulator
MSQQEAIDSHRSRWIETGPPADGDLESVRPSAAPIWATDELGTAIADQLNGPLTALLLYMGELKQHSRELPPGTWNRLHLQQVIENALEQTERVCAIMKQMAGTQEGPAVASARKAGCETRVGRAGNILAPGVMVSSESHQKLLTKREREVLSLISEGCSNKQGALRMRISPRTFESHRAEAMRKLGARNTADLVRKALQHSQDV